MHYDALKQRAQGKYKIVPIYVRSRKIARIQEKRKVIPSITRFPRLIDFIKIVIFYYSNNLLIIERKYDTYISVYVRIILISIKLIMLVRRSTSKI